MKWLLRILKGAIGRHLQVEASLEKGKVHITVSLDGITLVQQSIVL